MSGRVVFHGGVYRKVGWEDAIVGPRRPLRPVAVQWLGRAPLRFYAMPGQEARAVAVLERIRTLEPSCDGTVETL